MPPPTTRSSGSGARISVDTEPMPTVHLIAADGKRITLKARRGQSLMKAAIAGGVDGIAADCGGCLNCATCHVYVSEDWLARLPAPAKDELAMLEMTASERRANSRLSCQIALDDALDGLTVELPPTQY
jgi:ferredoxin, 2Fe-2S